MISQHLTIALFSYALLGIYTDIQALVYSTLPGPLNQIYNATLIQHYHIWTDVKGLSVVSTCMIISVSIGSIISLTKLMVLFDKKGRKFVNVYVRTGLGLAVGFLQLAAFQLQSAELYFVSEFFLGLSIILTNSGVQLYITECAPDEHRGFVSTVLAAGDTIAAILMYFLSSPNILGNNGYMIYIPIISIILCIALFLFSYNLPDSPKWLVLKEKWDEARNSIELFHGNQTNVENVMISLVKEANLSEKAGIKEVLRDLTLRESLKVVITTATFNVTSSTLIEGMYVVIIYTSLGMKPEEVLAMTLIIRLLLCPMRFTGTILIDKYGRRPILFLAGFLSLLKLIVMITALSIVFFNEPSFFTVCLGIFNEILSELYFATGVRALPNLLVVELFPPTTRISAMQVIFTFPMFFTAPYIVFPTIFAIFPPAFYILMILYQPLLLLYLYKVLPETKARSTYDIVQSFDYEVRSRANTAYSEKLTLLASRRNTLNYGYCEDVNVKTEDKLTM